MSKKVFISYSHKQSEWVLNSLVPVLRAGGADVLIDYERLNAGIGIIGQMDSLQDQADLNLLILSGDYVSSDYCRHEMERAIIVDPEFIKGSVIAIKRVDSEIPLELKKNEPLWVNLLNDSDVSQWDLLLRSCEADLGTDVPLWLGAVKELLQFLERNQSVNLVITGNPKWREIIDYIQEKFPQSLGIVDLERGSVVSRPGLVKEILSSLGIKQPVPQKPDDLGHLHNAITARRMSYVALLHADLMIHRLEYGIDFFSTLRNLMTEGRNLVLLVQSRCHFTQLMPNDHPLSSIDIKTVELAGKKL